MYPPAGIKWDLGVRGKGVRDEGGLRVHCLSVTQTNRSAFLAGQGAIQAHLSFSHLLPLF